MKQMLYRFVCKVLGHRATNTCAWGCCVHSYSRCLRCHAPSGKPDTSLVDGVAIPFTSSEAKHP